jgi:peptidoglycan L-alanyl-D-glutamate endopeptidase CwlK
MRKYSSRSLNSLEGIHPDLRRVIDRALQKSPLDFIVIEGVRSRRRQAELVAKGASQTMNSRHITGHAVDLLPIGPNGPEFAWPLYYKLGPAVKAAAQAEGVPIVWGGDWKSFKDGPHFELDREAYPETDWTTGQPAPKPRTSRLQSKTVQASAMSLGGAVGTATSAVAALDSTAQYIVLGFAGIIAIAALFIMRERLKAWASGWR